MNVIRFNPFAEVTSLRDQINRLFDDVGQPQPEGGRGGVNRMWAPLADVSENENELVVRLDLPGANRDTVDVQLTGDTLTIRGERRFERREGEGHVHLERPFGSFQRSFSLAVPIQSDRVRASYEDGVLTVALPKQEAVKPRKIQIQSGNQASQE